MLVTDYFHSYEYSNLHTNCNDDLDTDKYYNSYPNYHAVTYSVSSYKYIGFHFKFKHVFLVALRYLDWVGSNPIHATPRKWK